MGFRAPTYLLVWPEGSPLAGLEIRMRSISLGVVRELTRFQALDVSGEVTEDDMAVIVGVASTLAGLVSSWNIEDDDGNPVPVTAETVAGLDLGILFAAIGQLLDKVVSIGAPLGTPSTGGASPVAPSIPMETL